MTWVTKPCPKPPPPKKLRGGKRGAPTGRPRTRLKSQNVRRKGRAFGASRVDEAYLTWIRTLPCAICALLGDWQRAPTEVEHFVPKSHGGYDRRDTYPTCGLHREMRHVTMGPKAFTRMLQARGFDERALCKKLVTMYELEVWPCP